MDSQSVVALHLNDLCQTKPERPGWSLTFGASCAEAAAICLDEQGHIEPIVLQVEGIQPCEIELK
ncbi:hypothetical protein [Acaryochloris thomasi]|uniref:hypothetical protein n=1 Tax=Acaryochloris thomasi TaxID=2929456 RepID=UPI0018F23F45|nr:hypothetical protein [Acaryochloris thomasi]